MTGPSPPARGQAWIGRPGGAPLAPRLVAIRKPPEATEKTRTRLLAKAREKQHVLQDGTLVAAGWVILITSLDAVTFPAKAVGDMYRLRWRIEACPRAGGDCFQTSQKRCWSRPTARRGRERGEGPHPVPSADDPAHRAAPCRATRRLSPQGGRVKNGAWRLLRLLAAALYAAIVPAPTFRAIDAAAPRLKRHTTEPPRRRAYQDTAWIS